MYSAEKQAQNPHLRFFSCTDSHFVEYVFRNLISLLANSLHVVAPDYPGFGLSSTTSHDSFGCGCWSAFSWPHGGNDGIGFQEQVAKPAAWLEFPTLQGL
jgi:pimeloyl-ACP methyl ester carboxylesterase